MDGCRVGVCPRRVAWMAPSDDGYIYKRVQQQQQHRHVVDLAYQTGCTFMGVSRGLRQRSFSCMSPEVPGASLPTCMVVSASCVCAGGSTSTPAASPMERRRPRA